MSSYRQRRRLAPVMWTFIVLLALPPGWVSRARASDGLWQSDLTHDAAMESFRNPQITSGQYNRFLMTQNPSRLLGGGADDFEDPSDYGYGWTAEPNAQFLNRVEWSEHDLSMPGISSDLVFSRIYRGSVTEYDGPLGQQWDFSWNKRIEIAAGTIKLYDMGRVDTYVYNSGSGVYTAPGRYDALTYDSTFVSRTDRFGITETYLNEGDGWYSLYSIEDLHGNKASFAYNSSGPPDYRSELTQVWSDAGYFATLDYDSAGRMTNIHDWAGERDWYYKYNDSGRLTEVAGPPTFVGGVLSGHSFGESIAGVSYGRRTKYAYDSSSGALLSISQANDSTGTSFAPSWSWFYDSFGNVTTQMINGNPLTISYALTGGTLTTTVLDRESNKTAYEYDGSARVTKRKTYYDATHSWDTTWSYNSDNEVTDVIFPRGNRIHYAYDSLGNVLNVQFKKDATDSTPIQWTYTYTTHSRLSTLTDPNGRAWDYDYNATGDLTQRTAPTVTVPVFNDGSGAYNPGGTNKNGSLNSTNDGVIVETWAYDEWGNVTHAVDGMGTVRDGQYAKAVSDPAYGKKNLTKLIADPGSTHIQVTYQWVYDGLGHAITFIDPTSVSGDKETAYHWNSEDELIHVDEPGGVTRDYFHDLNGNISRTTESDDNAYATGAFITDLAYDRLNQVTRMIVDQDATTRLTTTYSYDKNDRLTGLTEPGTEITQWTYDVRDLRTTITRKAATSTDDAITTLAYDSNGSLTAATNPRSTSYVTTLAYDGYDRLTKVTRPEGDYRTLAYDAASNLTDFSSYNVGNTKLAEVKYAFDEANRNYQTETLAKKADLSTNIDSDGWQTRTLWRDENGNVLEARREGGSTPYVTYVYDALDRLITIKDALTTYQNSEARLYDLYGDLVTVERSDVSQNSGIEGNKTVRVLFDYDVRHRVTKKREQLVGGGSPVYADTTYDYGKRDQLTLVTDGVGRKVTYAYNERLWPGAESVNIANDSDPSNDVITEHLYDMSARKVTYKATNGTTGNQLTVYEYDPLWRLIHTTWPDGGISSYTYDKAGNRLGFTDPNGTVRSAQYDKNDRLTVQDNTITSPVVGATQLTFAYDALDRLTQAQSIEGATFDVLDVWTYNTLGNAQTDRQVINGYNADHGRSFGYVWDVNGQKAAVTYPASNWVVSYDRDKVDRPTTISLAGSQVSAYTYSGPRIIRKEFPGSRATFTYDGLGRLTDILHEDSSPAQTIAEFKYGYDLGHQAIWLDKHYWNGNDTTNVTINADTSDRGEQYAYDAAGRLVSCLRGVPSTYIASDPSTNTHYDNKVQYFYDQTGNRLSRKTDGTTDQTCAYDLANEMTAENSVAQSYTANGSFSGVSNTYKYDHADRMARATAGGVTYQYHYDALGRLVQRDHATTSVRFYYDGLSVAEQENLAGLTETLKKVFVFGPQIDELLLYVDIAATPDAYHYAHSDRLGSIQLFVDSSGSIKESYRYKEFGETTIVNGSFTKQTSVDSPIGDPYRYTGRREDIQVGAYGDDWYDYRARIVRCNIGRFLQADPWEYINGPSRYVYCVDNPLNWLDPLGRDINVLGHSVGGGPWWHTSIRITPKDQEKWAHAPGFKQNKNGKWYTILSAAPGEEHWICGCANGVPYFGWKTPLQKERFHETDTGPQGLRAKVDIGTADENAVIDKLLANFDGYQSGDTYALFPGTTGDGYNSNSFTSGLLQASGVQAPSISESVPGYDTPVPADHFGE